MEMLKRGDILIRYVKYKEIQVLENLIKEYKKTKYELESVKEIYYTQKEIETDYIPKSKVKEKIEELKKNEDCRYCNNACHKYARCMMLQELMEDK